MSRHNIEEKIPWLRIALLTGLLLAAILLLSWPDRSIVQTAQSAADREGNLNFSGAEAHPSGYQFAWAVPNSALLYPDAPRYAPLNLTLRLNLERSPGLPPAIIEVYERPANPTEDEPSGKVEGTERLVATLRFDPARPGPQDYFLSLTPRERGDGVYITFKANTFQVGSDRRQLAFMFVRAELQLPRSHLRYLFWPNIYFPAVALFLAAVIIWCWRVGLGWLATTAFNSMLAYALMMAAQSTWRVSWLMLLLAFAVWGCYSWFNQSQKAGRNSFWPLFVACGCVITLFLLTNDNLKGDTIYYINWSRAIHQYGLWDVYTHEPSLNYLPLVVYLLWFYNLIVYPFGWQESILAWRIFASLLYMVLLFVLYLITRCQVSGFRYQKSEIRNQASAHRGQKPAPTTHPSSLIPHPSSPIPHPSSLLWLVLVGFNVSLFYNPTLWGQSDIIATLPLALAFYLIYRCEVRDQKLEIRDQKLDIRDQKLEVSQLENPDISSLIPHPSSFPPQSSVLLYKWPLLAGLALGAVAISKPQAWFVLPVALLLFLLRAGWKRGLVGLAAGAVLALGLGLVAFGFDQESFNRYWGQGQLTGDYRYDFPAAYNLNYLVLGLRTEVPGWLAVLGFGLVGLVVLLVAWRSWRGATEPRDTTLAAALLNTACFTFLIKMKERYLMYAMPLFGLGTHYNRKLIWPFLALSWLQLLNVSILMFQSGRSRLQTLPENFYFWSSLLSQDWLRRGIAVGFILTLLYMVFYYWRTAGKAVD